MTRTPSRLAARLALLLVLPACGTFGGDDSGAEASFPDLGLRFTHPRDLLVGSFEGGTLDRPQHLLLVVEDTEENRALLQDPGAEPRTAPAHISVEVHANPEGLEAESWVRSFTNGRLRAETLERAEVAGEPALGFPWDGLEAGRSVVVAAADRTFVFSVRHLHPGDRLEWEFEALLESIRFLDGIRILPLPS